MKYEKKMKGGLINAICDGLESQGWIIVQHKKKERNWRFTEKLTIRLEKQLLDALNNEYANKKLYNKVSFSEFIRQKLKKGEQK